MRAVIASLGFFLSAAAGHTIFQELYVNGVSQGHLNGIRVPDYDGPITDVTSNDVICNGGINPFHQPISTTVIPVAAGSQVTAEWHHTLSGAAPGDAADPIDASHKGPVMAYLAKVPSATQSSVTGLQWFKVWEDGLTSDGKWGVDRLIANKGKVTFTLPSCIAAGQYLLRVEIIALHAAGSYPGAQLYMECAQLQITGGGNTSPATVSFPGAYKGSDPGITINIYQTLSGYTIPGPRPFSCSGSPAPTQAPTQAPPASTPVTNPPPASTSAASGTVAQWGQCGGIGYTGPTACIAPFKCTKSSDYKDHFMGDKSSFMDILYSTAAASAILRSQDEPKDQYPILLSFYHSICVLRDQDHAIPSRLMPGLRDILALLAESPAGTSQPQLELAAFRDAELWLNIHILPPGLGGGMCWSLSASSKTVFSGLSVDGVDQGHAVGVRVPSSNNAITDVNSNDIICNTNFIQPVSDAVIKVPAGSQVTAQFHHTSAGYTGLADPSDPLDPTNKGPVTAYLAAIPDATQPTVTGLKWFKVWQDGYNSETHQWASDRLFLNKGNATFTIPSCIASGQYLLRAEAIGLQNAYTYPGAQFYMSCAQIEVTGGGSATPQTVSFPGAYATNSASIITNIYGITDYTPPGPAVFTC
ncbi:hypothetical protein EYR36_004603 [Pleurotus pulmonarius]|nr:hypothetical protein EYR36_004603 [Pleurotus pulmonarius]